MVIVSKISKMDYDNILLGLDLKVLNFNERPSAHPGACTQIKRALLSKFRSKKLQPTCCDDRSFLLPRPPCSFRGARQQRRSIRRDLFGRVSVVQQVHLARKKKLSFCIFRARGCNSTKEATYL